MLTHSVVLRRYCFSTLISIYSPSRRAISELLSPPRSIADRVWPIADKFMFSQEPGHYNFPYPLFVTSVHMLVQWCLSATTLYFFRGLRPTTRPKLQDYACVHLPLLASVPSRIAAQWNFLLMVRKAG